MALNGSLPAWRVLGGPGLELHAALEVQVPILFFSSSTSHVYEVFLTNRRGDPVQ